MLFKLNLLGYKPSLLLPQFFNNNYENVYEADAILIPVKTIHSVNKTEKELLLLEWKPKIS